MGKRNGCNRVGARKIPNSADPLNSVGAGRLSAALRNKTTLLLAAAGLGGLLRRIFHLSRLSCHLEARDMPPTSA